MRVVIKEKEYDYVSDFPDGWVFSKGDYFKVVKIFDKHTCFIKRFEVKTPANISGWKLMVNLKGKNENNLSRLYDIAETRESGKNIYYVFYEFIEGETLYKLISQNAEIDFKILTEDLICAIQSLQKKDYWFADFTEKNIFCDKKGRFVLIDLDSAQPASEAPNNDMWGEKEYWVLVLNFYKEILHKQQLLPSDINGISLNYLQIVFLVLRLKIFYSGKQNEYYSHELFDHLPAYLNNLSPSFKIIFNKLFQNNKLPPQSDDINEIKNLIEKYIINIQPPSTQPVINEFIVNDYFEKDKDDYVVEKGKIFTLKWNVENASDIELYKNGNFYKKLGNGEKNTEFTEEVRNSTETKIEYTLVALKDSAKKDAKSLTITVKELIPPEPPVINKFRASNYIERNGDDYVIESGKPFKLYWDVQNVSNLQLYKDGELYKKLNSSEKNLELTEETYNNKREKIEYKLVASNKSIQIHKLLIVEIIALRREPVINEFTVSNYVEKSGDEYVIEDGKIFTLNWDVHNALNLELYKNGEPYKKLIGSKSSIELKEELYDGKEKPIEYTLHASNTGESIKSNPLTIKIIYPNPVIKDFIANNYVEKNANTYVIENGKTFILKWDVSNVSHIELYKDGTSYKKFNTDIKSIELKEEIYDGKEKETEYILFASNKSASIKSKPIIIKFIYLPPLINQFKTNKYTVRDGKVFRLTWDIKNASVLELYKDGKLYQQLNPAENSIELTEKAYHREKKEIEYSLLASNRSMEIKSDPVFITLKPPPPPIVKIIMLAFVVVVILSITLFFLLRPAVVNVYAFTRNKITESDTITFFGKNLPPSKDLIHVKFNNVEGIITQVTKKSLSVQVPKIASTSEYVTILVNIGRTFFKVSDHVLYVVKTPPPPPPGPTVSLPASLNEIWHGSNEFVNVNLPQRIIYYSGSNKEKYGAYYIGEIDSTTGIYKIAVKAEQGEKLFLIKNVKPQSFELSVCEDSLGKDCKSFNKMSLYYETNPSVIYLPNNPEADDLEESQKTKLTKITRNPEQLTFIVSVSPSNKFTPNLYVNEVTDYLNKKGIKYTIQKINSSQTNVTPFQRNYVSLLSKSDSHKPTTYSPDCSKTFTSIDQTQRLASPLIVCKLNLSGVFLSKIPAEVYTFTNLQELDLGSNPILEVEINRLKKVLPACTIKWTSKPPEDEESLGYIEFDANNEPNDAGRNRIEQIADQLKANPHWKIKFYADWDKNNSDEEATVGRNINGIKNYFNGFGIGLSSKQLDTKVVAVKRANKDINRVYLTRIVLPNN